MGSEKLKKSFGVFNNMFKTKIRSRRGDDPSGISDEFMKAYRVFPSDEDRGRWIAEPGIDRKASAYIATTQANWNTTSSAVSN